MIALEARDVRVTYKRRGSPPLHALDGVSLTLQRGTTFGLIGESGSGKSSMARLLVGLVPPAAGEILLYGERLLPAGRRQRLQSEVQMIFQDATGALNPRQTIFRSLADVLTILRHIRCSRQQLTDHVARLLEQVGLPPDVATRYPAELSGGQCQRICIARALAVEPSILIADEPVSALDVSVQARILRLLRQLQRERRLTLLLISHDLAVINAICDQAAVLKSGRIVEAGPPHKLFNSPQDPYTRRLVAAAESQLWQPTTRST